MAIRVCCSTCGENGSLKNPAVIRIVRCPKCGNATLCTVEQASAARVQRSLVSSVANTAGPTNGNGHAATAVAKRPIRIVKSPPPIPQVRKQAAASNKWFYIAATLFMMLVVCGAAGVYFYYVPEEWTMVKGAVLVSKEKLVKQLVWAQQPKNEPKLNFCFDVNDFSKTRGWAMSLADKVQDIADTKGNQLVVNEHLASLQPDFEKLKGQTVHWRLFVDSVTNSHVVLHGVYDGLMIFQEVSSDTDLDDYMGRLNSVVRGGSSINLKIGRDIAAQEAVKLHKNSQVAVEATVTEVSMARRLAMEGLREVNEPVVRVKLVDVTTLEAPGRLPEEVISLTIRQLKEAYANELVGKDLYHGKRVQMTGMFASGFGHSICDPVSGMQVRCSFTRELPRELRTGSINDNCVVEVTVTGIVDGEDTLKKCRLLTSESEVKRQFQRRDKALQDANVKKAEALEQDLYNTPAVSSDQNWVLNQIREVEGKVKKINSPKNDGRIHMSLSFDGTDTTLGCCFLPKFHDHLATLKPGMVVRVKGKYSSYGTLDPCVFLK